MKINNIYAKEVKRYTQNSESANVLVTDGIFECWAHCSPCKLKVNQKIVTSLTAFMAEDIVIYHKHNFKLLSPLGSETIGAGVLINIDNAQVKVGGFLFELDGILPGDIKIGDYISFKCDRIDIDDF